MNQFLKYVPLAKAIEKTIRFNLQKTQILVKKLENEYYCKHCYGKGYHVCNKCHLGCTECQNCKYLLCQYCSGLGFNHYTYF